MTDEDDIPLVALLLIPVVDVDDVTLCSDLRKSKP